MATATKSKAVTITASLREEILGGLAWLRGMNIERDEDLEILFVCVLAGIDPLYLGEAGVGKTYFIQLFTRKVLKDAALYMHLLAKDQSANELLGPPDIMGMKEGKVRRLTDGFSPTSHVSYWDEVFKASPPMLNPALDLLANRELKMGGEIQDCSQLITVIMSSNELPEREDLIAFRDRIALTKVVKPIATDEGRRALIDLQLDGQSNIHFPDAIGLDGWSQAREEVSRIDFPHVMREKLTEAWRMWAEYHHAPSGRRVGDMLKAMKAQAYLRGREAVNADDLMICQHMAWNKPDNAKTARQVVIALAEAFTRKAEEIREAQEPILSGVNDLRVKIRDAKTKDDQDELIEAGFKLLRGMKTLIRKAEGLIEDGEREGEDTTRLNEVREEIEKQHNWSEEALSATDL